MPELHMTESQRERFDALQEKLAAEHAGPYASVRQQDVVDYLLDLAEDVDGTERALEGGTDLSSPSTAEGDGDEPGADSTGQGTQSTGETDPTGGATSGAASGGPGGMLNLLERHDEKWREASGEERYEVELEDGSVETARTKDDVKAILFRHY